MYNSKMNIKMNDKNKAPFKVEDVNWDELSGIGILKDELEQAVSQAHLPVRVHP